MVADIDIDYWDSGIMELKEGRRLKGQEVKLLSGEREEITIKDLPELVINIADLQNEYEKIIKSNREIEEAKEGLVNLELHLEKAKEEVKELEHEIEINKISLKGKKLISVEQIRGKMNEAETINEQIKARGRNCTADKRQLEAQNIYDDFTKKIEKIVKEKETALSDAKMPIHGLGVSDTGVTYNNIPFGQLSSSEQLKVSMSIAIALNPKLRVIRVTDGSLLDDNNMKVIKSMAKENDFQIWVEKITDSSGIAFVIEEGEVKNGD
ncbi:hypothetical protein ES708_31672 [subsurface metagenome]